MTINEWLSNPSDFDAGVALYEKYGTSGNMKRLIRISGDTPKWRKTLMYELSKLKDKDCQTAAAAPVPGKEPEEIYTSEENKSSRVKLVDEFIESFHKVNDVIKEIKYSKLPASINDLEKEWKDLYKICNHKKSSLSLSMDPRERAELCLYIVETFPNKIHPIWDKLDHYKKHGQLPEESIIQVKSLDPVSLVTRRNSLRSYITKANKGHKYLKPESVPAWQAEIEAIEGKLNELKTTA